METFYLILFVPVLIAAIAWWKFNHTFVWQEAVVQVVVVSAIIAGVWFAGSYSQTHDTEIWNGAITKKVRDHGHYLRSYQCNCYTSCSGSGDSRSCHQVCQTCYEDRYTVDWHVKTTVGDIQLQYFDRGSRRVYNEPDPPQYTNAYVGEPCSTEESYTNYIKAVPESLFNEADTEQLAQFADLIPPYPRVHSYYKVMRVLTPGIDNIDTTAWNDALNEKQKLLGGSKQVNIILAIVNTTDQTYRYALERAWLGGKKNDVIVIIGASNYPTIDWVDTITLGQNAGNSLMTVRMRDSIMSHKTLEDHVAVVDTINDIIFEHFDRKPMADYEYLKDEIDPPLWIIIAAFILAFVLSIAGAVYFHRNDVFGVEGSRFYNRRYK